MLSVEPVVGDDVASLGDELGVSEGRAEVSMGRTGRLECKTGSFEENEC